MTKVRTLSLFTGAGGLDVGFHQAGFDISACVEVNRTFCRTLEMNRGNYLGSSCKIINRDICKISPEEITSDRCDFIIGGPPCQSFSAAGRRAGGVTGVNDDRGSLFEHYCRLIRHFKPKGFLFENVRGILSANKKNDWELILSAFSDLGYQIAFRVLDAADYGVPQHRERLILVGTERGRDFLFPRPTHGPDSTGSKPYVSCIQAIADLQDPNEKIHEYQGKYGSLLNQVPPGLNYHYFTREMGDSNPTFAWRSRFSDFLYKAHPDFPVRTIVARLGAYSGPFHWKNRRFTIAEFKRLFTFPDDYKFAGETNSILRQLGNSVPSLFAQQLALSVQRQLFDRDMPVDLLPKDYVLSFDGRKKEKRGKTREAARQHRLLSTVVPLTEFSESGAGSNNNLCESGYETYYCAYPSWKKRKRFEKRPSQEEGISFRVREERERMDSHIVVQRFHRGKFIARPLLEYRLHFHHAVGDGLRSITCELDSEESEDVVAAWDAIEEYLNKHTNFISLMDVFGHFTEPHPIFSLELRMAKIEGDFLMRFIEYFSDFQRVAVDYPESLLRSFASRGADFDFLGTVKWLRSLRLDVRVHETNPTIKPGFFRCCYPFTLHVEKQIAVSWADRPMDVTHAISRNHPEGTA